MTKHSIASSLGLESLSSRQRTPLSVRAWTILRSLGFGVASTANKLRLLLLGSLTWEQVRCRPQASYDTRSTVSQCFTLDQHHGHFALCRYPLAWPCSSSRRARGAAYLRGADEGHNANLHQQARESSGVTDAQMCVSWSRQRARRRMFRRCPSGSLFIHGNSFVMFAKRVVSLQHFCCLGDLLFRRANCPERARTFRAGLGAHTGTLDLGQP